MEGNIIMLKKFLTRLLCISTILNLFCISGCSPAKQAIVNNTLPIECKIYENKLIITLNENPTTGYGWKFKMDRDEILELESDKYKSDENSHNLTGVGGKHTWIFKGISKGIVVITFKYFRHWEDESTAVETKSFTINVVENGWIESVR